MHEYSLMEGILEGVLKDLATRGIDRPGTVKEVHLALGCLEIHSRESFAQAFTVATRGTVLEGSTLALTILPAELACSRCGYEGVVKADGEDGHDPLPIAECPSCGMLSAVRGGRGVHSVELTLEES